MAIFLIVFAALLPVVVGLLLLLDRARTKQIERDRHLPRVVIPLTDYALVASPLLIQMLLLLFSISDSFADTLARTATASLDLLCATPIPLPMCRIPRPANMFVGILLGGHLAFVIVTALLFWRIVIGTYPRPINYDARPTSRRAAIVCVVGWLLVFVGAYVFMGRASFFAPSLGAALAATFCRWLKFGRAPEASR